jgi:Arylsulfotransferase (ASST)
MAILRRPGSASARPSADPAGRRLRRGLVGGGVVVLALGAGTLVPAIGRIQRENAPYSGPDAARCIPRQLNRTAALPGTGLAVSPLPDSYDAAPATQISMVGVPSDEIADVSVTGSLTGDHRGRLVPYSQGDGASFVPEASFQPGETVDVRGTVRSDTGSTGFQYSFTVDYPDPIPYEPPGPKPQLTPGSYQSFHSAPQLHPPTVDVTYSSPATQGGGDILAAPYSGPGSSGPMIFEANGQLVWMDPLPEHEFAANLQVQSYAGSRVLTWWQGYIPQNGFGMGEEVVADGSYTPLLHVRAGNGYRADLHVFRLEANDTALLTVFNTIHCDLTSVGGPRDGDLSDTELQELDLKTGLVRREWSGVDHVALGASYASATQASAKWPYDFLHINSVALRADGTMLLSARNTSQLYLIEPRSGQVQTTIGGKSSGVKMEAGTETAYQHDAQTLEDGDISIFDNGGSPFTTHQQSRALIVELDSQDRTETKVAEFTHPRPLQASSQGSVQRLPDGDWFVGWGGEPYFTEFNASGAMIYDAHLPLEGISSEHGEHTASYRGLKSEWTATPTWPPAIATERTGSGLTVYASWNGATGVSSWRVLGGPSPDRLAQLTSAPRSGFETAIRVESQPYVEVQALDSTGATIGRSRAVAG